MNGSVFSKLIDPSAHPSPFLPLRFVPSFCVLSTTGSGFLITRGVGLVPGFGGSSPFVPVLILGMVSSGPTGSIGVVASVSSVEFAPEERVLFPEDTDKPDLLASISAFSNFSNSSRFRRSICDFISEGIGGNRRKTILWFILHKFIHKSIKIRQSAMSAGHS